MVLIKLIVTLGKCINIVKSRKKNFPQREIKIVSFIGTSQSKSCHKQDIIDRKFEKIVKSKSY